MYYKYHVLSETGSNIKGSMEGTPEVVKKALKKDGYYIMSVRPDILTSVKASFTRRKVKARDLSVFFEDMANMLHTGIAINEAVIALKGSLGLAQLAKALDSIERDLKGGFSLAASFDKTKAFPGLVISMLKVGEKSGNLEKVLRDLSRHYSREADFIAGLKSTLIYPFIVFSTLIGIMFYVSFKVIPHLEALLPITANNYFATKLLLFLSHFLKDYWYICILLPVVIICLLFKPAMKSASLE